MTRWLGTTKCAVLQSIDPSGENGHFKSHPIMDGKCHVLSRRKRSASGEGFEECPAVWNYDGKGFEWESGTVTWLASSSAMLFEELGPPP